MDVQDNDKPAVMSAEAAAEYLVISVSTLKRLVREGKGPKYARISRLLSFRKSDLDTWLAAQFDKPAKKAKKAKDLIAA
jgi:excisionase family DNA binding protein